MLHVGEIIALVGATIIFTRGTIFHWIRRVWPSFFGCPLCVGFWTGLHASLWIHKLPFWSAFYAGCIVSLCAYVMALIIYRLDS